MVSSLSVIRWFATVILNTNVSAVDSKFDALVNRRAPSYGVNSNRRNAVSRQAKRDGELQRGREQRINERNRLGGKAWV